MKTTIKITSLAMLTVLLTVHSCKKKKNDKTAPQPTTTTTTPPVYSSFLTTIAVIDYTAPAPTSVMSSYSVNLSPTTTAMAYIIADGNRIDSLTLNITRVADLIVPPSITWLPDVCDTAIWNHYLLNVKAFKIKNGASNSLCVYEDGVKISSVPIAISGNYISYPTSFNSWNIPINNGFPLTSGERCVECLRYRVIQ